MNVNNTSILVLPSELIGEGLAPHLPVQDCARMATVCKLWGSIFTKVCDERLYDLVVFDEKKWLQIPGVKSVSNYEVDPAKKAELIKRLKSPCDIFNEKDPIQPHRFENPTNKLICETRMVILFPQEINGEAVSMNRIGQIFHYAKTNETGTGFQSIFGNEEEEYRNRLAERTYFAEVTLDVIPKSRETSQYKKEQLLNSKGYKVPSLLEGIISNLVMNLGKEKELFFGPGTYTTTSEEYGRFFSHRVIVGDSVLAGPRVIYSFMDDDSTKITGAMAIKDVDL